MCSNFLKGLRQIDSERILFLSLSVVFQNIRLALTDANAGDLETIAAIVRISTGHIVHSMYRRRDCCDSIFSQIDSTWFDHSTFTVTAALYLLRMKADANEDQTRHLEFWIPFLSAACGLRLPPTLTRIVFVVASFLPTVRDRFLALSTDASLRSMNRTILFNCFNWSCHIFSTTWTHCLGWYCKAIRVLFFVRLPPIRPYWSLAD